MAKITYTDKVIGSKWRAVDANEVKTSVNSLYDDKVDKVAGKGLSEEDYTTDEQSKLEGIEAGANKTLFADEAEVIERSDDTKAVTPLSLAATLDKIDQLYNSSGVAEDRARRSNVAWAYTGTVRMVGVGQTYTTISAAITAAVSGDIIQLIDGTYNTASESGGYLLINDASKRLLIRGNAANNSAVTIQLSSVASFCVRLRIANQITFQNLKITSNQTNPAVTVEMGTPAGPVTCLFDNCIIENTSASAVNTVHLLGVLSNNNYYEFKNCTIYSNNNTGSRPIAASTITDANATLYSNPVLITGSTIYGFVTLQDSAVDFTAYDTAFIQRQFNSQFIIAFGSDVVAPVNLLSRIDIRSCSFKDENDFQGHAVLLGRGTKTIYFVNNYIFIGPGVDSLALGMVVKSTPSTIGGVVIDGNYIEAPRPVYIKGAVNCYIRRNQTVSNWADLTAGYGFELQNPNNPDGPIASIGNVIIHNNLRGKIGAMSFTTQAGAASGSDSAKLCIFNNNIYMVSDGTTYIDGSPDVAWINRGDFWTQDTNSRFIVI